MFEIRPCWRHEPSTVSRIQGISKGVNLVGLDLNDAQPGRRADIQSRTTSGAEGDESSTATASGTMRIPPIVISPSTPS